MPDIAAHLLQIFVYLSTPVAAILLSAQTQFERWLNPVIVCYAIGILLGNQEILQLNSEISIQLSEISIPLSISLLLFSLDFREWLRLARTSLLSFVLSMVAAIVSAALAWLLYNEQFEDTWKLAGMMVGVYIGGTPNMSAIGLALNVKEEVFILLNTSDILLGTLYLLFLLTLARPFLKNFFLPFSAQDNPVGREAEIGTVKSHILMALPGLLLSAIILAVSVGFSQLLTGRMSILIIIMTVTSLGIGASFVKKIRKLPYSFQSGEYLMLIFCVSIGSLADFGNFNSISLNLFYFCAISMTGAILLHFLMSRFFRVDVDTLIITSVAGIFGPALVPLVANRLQNKEMIYTGLVCGIVGYALANYLGLGLAYLLASCGNISISWP